MARRNAPRETVELPDQLTAAMRRAWRRIDGWSTNEQQDAIWDALKRFRVRRRDGNGAAH
jgi:hypothetical protein